MTFSNDDIRAAVSSGILSELQGDRLATLANTRQSGRANLSDIDEPFEVFRGFNEIFVVVGLSILFSGWFSLAFSGDQDTGTRLIALGGVGCIFTASLAYYFTTKRRMVAPSIALSVMFAISAVQIGMGLEGLLFGNPNYMVVTSALSAVFLFGYWWVFRVPFSVALIALAVFTLCISAFLIGDLDLGNPTEIFILSAEGPLALVTMFLGLVGFALAMRFDMSDPNRVTRRSLNGFWLHIVAAPAIVNTVALTLFENGSGLAQIALLIFVICMALVAIVIDRRSFLLAGVGYVVALSATVIDGGASVAILIFGLLLVLLGAGWEKIRARIMAGLPGFPGKDRLPPYFLPELVTK